MDQEFTKMPLVQFYYIKRHLKRVVNWIGVLIEPLGNVTYGKCEVVDKKDPKPNERLVGRSEVTLPDLLGIWEMEEND